MRIATGIAGVAAAILLTCGPAYADVVDDLLRALLPPGSSTPEVLMPPVQPAPVNPPPAATTTADQESSPQIEAQQIAALRQLIVTLTQQLSLLLQAKKNSLAASTTPAVTDTTSPEAVSMSEISDDTEICMLKQVLRRPMTGADVAILQRFLVSLGLLEENNVTGVFGTITEKGVQEWQKENGVIGYGSPNTTGFGVVGQQSRALMQKKCEKDDSSNVPKIVDPAASGNSNAIVSSDMPRQVRIQLLIPSEAFKRGEKIPVKIKVLDPVPYTGADIGFVQGVGQGVSHFPTRIYLPVGFSGDIEYYLNSAPMHISDYDKNTHRSNINIRALIEASFRNPSEDEDVTTSFGNSDWLTVTVSEDMSTSTLIFTADGHTPEGDDLKLGEFADFFSATTTSRANGIELCSLFSETLRRGVEYSCMWGNEDLAPVAQDVTKTVSPEGYGLDPGSYFMYWNGVVHGTNLAMSRADALQSCVQDHAGNPSVSMRCVWNNEVIYDKGPL